MFCKYETTNGKGFMWYNFDAIFVIIYLMGPTMYYDNIHKAVSHHSNQPRVESLDMPG